MNNPILINPLEEQRQFEKELAKFKKNNEQALKNIFKNEIKESFLISSLNNIKKKYDVYKYYPNAIDPTNEQLLRGTEDKVDYDICCHIIGIHKFNMLFLDDETKGKYQKDPKYQAKLYEDVYNQIKLRQAGSSFFVNKSLFAGDRFLYFPIGYDIFVSTVYLCDCFAYEKVLDNNPMHPFYTAIIEECLSILTQIENGLLLRTYPQARNLIELYFKYEVLFNNPDAIEEYQRFTDYQINYAVFNNPTDEFMEKYKKHENDASFTEYLHYGWIDSIFEFDYLGKDKKYSIPGLYNHLKTKYKNDPTIEMLKDLHNRCHMFSHGTTVSKTYQLQSLFDEIIPVLYNVIRAILIDICNILKKDAIIEGINIRKKMEADWKEMNEKRKLMTPDAVRKYYEKR